MFSIDAMRARLDQNFTQAIDQYQTLAQNTDQFAPEDIHLFNQAAREISVASWAANQDVVLTHNLVKAILNEVR